MFPSADVEDISQVTSQNRNTSPSSDEQYPAESNQAAKPNSNRELTLNMLFMEAIFCIALALTTYGALHNSSSKVSKHPQPVRFFSPHSPVTDWYKGQLGHALALVNSADVSFVMYYAPWDAESQHVRGEFEKAAEILSDRVYFSAINCWNPGSECRLQHNKIPSWPILMVYTVNSRGVFYTGPRDAHSMVKFLELVMQPLERISCTEDLVNLLSICDAVAIGFTTLSETSKHYNVWYNVAVNARQYDTVGEICFAAVTSQELALDLGVEGTPTARLMLWNDTKEYKLDENDMQSWNESALMNWMLGNFVQPVARIIPMWKKAFSFEKFVDGSPILMLFTPLNPVYEQLPAYSLLREVAMEYYNCKNNKTSQWTSELMKLQRVQRLLYQQKDFTKFCREYKLKHPSVRSKRVFKKHVISRNNKYPWSNGTKNQKEKESVFNFAMKKDLASKIIESLDDTSKLLSSMSFLHECGSRMLPAEKKFYDNYEQCHSFADNLDNEPEIDINFGDTETSMLPFEGDPLSSDSIIQDNVKHFCKLHEFAQQLGPVITPSKIDNSNISHIHGLACAKNYSLNMIALDSIRNHHFAESLGIDVLSKKDKTAVIILDSKLESQYLLSEEYSAKSIRDFIYNFTHKNLKRWLRTHVEDATHTHFFGSDGKTEQMGINESTVHLTDLTTKTFRRFVKTSKTLSIVAVCGGACGAHVSRAVLEAARVLAACGVRASPARIDALRHDLPWHYTVSSYPTVLVFTATTGGEPDSRAYPAAERVTAGGLAALALRSLGAPLHLRVSLNLCAAAGAGALSYTKRQKCLKDLKEHITSVIGRNLSYWRRTDDALIREALLRRLQNLHRVSLDLSLLHVTDLEENSPKQESLLNSLSTLTKNWDIDETFLRKATAKTKTR